MLYQCILTLWDFNKLNKCTLFWRKRHFSPHASLCLRAWKPCSGCDGAVWRASNRSRMWWRGAKFHQGWYEHFRVGILPAVSHTRGSQSKKGDVRSVWWAGYGSRSPKIPLAWVTMGVSEAPVGFQPPRNRDLDKTAAAVPAESLCWAYSLWLTGNLHLECLWAAEEIPVGC